MDGDGKEEGDKTCPEMGFKCKEVVCTQQGTQQNGIWGDAV